MKHCFNNNSSIVLDVILLAMSVYLILKKKVAIWGHRLCPDYGMKATGFTEKGK